MSTSADFWRLSIYFCHIQPNSADCCLLLPSSADFCLPVPTQSVFMLYIGTGWCYMYSSMKRSVNAKRLPPLPGQTSRDRPREKSRPYSIYSSRNRSGSEFRAESQKDLGSTGKRRPADELPRFSQGSLVRQKNEETNRHQQRGKTG